MTLQLVGAKNSAPGRTVDLSLNHKQADFLLSEERECAFVTGVGGGKTYCGSRWAWLMARQYSKAVGLITANSYKQLSQATLPPFFAFLESIGEEYAFNRAPAWYHSRYKKHDGIVSLRCGAQILTRSLENYDDLRGVEIGWWWGDEVRDTRREAYDVCVGRLRDKDGPCQMKLTTTPDGYNWLYEVFADELVGNPNLALQRKLIAGSTYDNAANLPDGYIDAMLANYDEDTARQEVYGEFVNIGVGLVYPTFNRHEHLDERITYDPTRPLYLACDFNVSPLAWIIAQESPDGVLLVVDEVHRDRPRVGLSATESGARDFINRYGDHAGMVEVFGDASGDSERSATTRTDWAIIRTLVGGRFSGRFRLRVPSSNPPVIDRVNTLNSKLRNARGEIGLRVHPRCKALRRDLEQVHWRESAAKREIDKIKDKTLTHPSDALGYLVFGLYRQGRRPVMSLGSGYEPRGM